MSQLYESLTLIRCVDDLGPRDQIPQADARQAVSLAERSRDDHVGMIREQGHGMVARIGEIGIGLVDDQGAVERPGQLGDLLARQGRPRGTVGIGQEEQLQSRDRQRTRCRASSRGE